MPSGSTSWPVRLKKAARAEAACTDRCSSTRPTKAVAEKAPLKWWRSQSLLRSNRQGRSGSSSCWCAPLYRTARLLPNLPKKVRVVKGRRS